jgi:UDP-glucose 4-epimerase
MKILILGSEGFIGSNLVSFFKKQNQDVVSADIILKVEDNYILINPESPNFASLFQNNIFDVCINATGAANVQFSFTYPHTDYYLNTANVYAILDSIRLFNPNCAFINLSSAAVYGNPKSLPILENSIIKPASPYGLHKQYSEQICTEFYDFFGIKTISVRIFSAYGPGLRKQLFWDLYQKLKINNETIELYGTGEETRDFVYIDDLIQAIHNIILSEFYTGNTINIASGVSSTIKTASLCFINNINPNLKVIFNKQTKEGDPLYWEANIDLLKSLGYKSQTTLLDGISKTADLLKNI